jgi:hypothetical protein
MIHRIALQVRDGHVSLRVGLAPRPALSHHWLRHRAPPPSAAATAPVCQREGRCLASSQVRRRRRRMLLRSNYCRLSIALLVGSCGLTENDQRHNLDRPPRDVAPAGRLEAMEEDTGSPGDDENPCEFEQDPSCAGGAAPDAGPDQGGGGTPDSSARACSGTDLGSALPVDVMGDFAVDASSAADPSLADTECALVPAGTPDRVFRWTPPHHATYVISTRGSDGYHPPVYLRSSCEGVDLACGETPEVVDPPPFNGTIFTMTLEADVPSLLFVEKWDTLRKEEPPTGPFQLHISLVEHEFANRYCADGIDNDVNGLVDCRDPACATDLTCQP